MLVPPSFRKYVPSLLILSVIVALCVMTHTVTENFRLFAAAVVVGFAVASWTLGLLAEPLTTLLFFLLVVTFGVADSNVVFSGFASGAWWLLLGGSIIAAAVETTGLGARLAALLFGRWTFTYPLAVAAVAVGALGLIFLMPSAMGRTLLMIPVVRAFAAGLGLTPDRRGYAGLMITGAAATYMPSTAVLPANIPNTILLGAADTLYGVKITYGPYFLLHFPVLGILKTVVLVWLACRLFPDHVSPDHKPAFDVTPMSKSARSLSWLLAVALVLYATDTIHGISPAWVTLGAGILCVLPPWGMLTPKVMAERVNLISLLYIAGILGLGAVVADSGLSEVISTWILSHIQPVPGDTPTNVAALGAIGIILTLLTTATGLPAVLTPLSGEFAAATGLPITTVLMLQVIGFSTVVLPYVSPPMMVWLSMTGVEIRAASKLCLALTAVSCVILFPIDYVWWRLLGYLP